MINELKYGQTWKIWPSPLSLSLYSTFKASGMSKISIILLFANVEVLWSLSRFALYFL